MPKLNISRKNPTRAFNTAAQNFRAALTAGPFDYGNATNTLTLLLNVANLSSPDQALALKHKQQLQTFYDQLMAPGELADINARQRVMLLTQIHQQLHGRLPQKIEIQDPAAPRTTKTFVTRDGEIFENASFRDIAAPPPPPPRGAGGGAAVVPSLFVQVDSATGELSADLAQRHCNIAAGGIAEGADYGALQAIDAAGNDHTDLNFTGLLRKLGLRPGAVQVAPVLVDGHLAYLGGAIMGGQYQGVVVRDNTGHEFYLRQHTRGTWEYFPDEVYKEHQCGFEDYGNFVRAYNSSFKSNLTVDHGAGAGAAADPSIYGSLERAPLLDPAGPPTIATLNQLAAALRDFNTRIQTYDAAADLPTRIALLGDDGHGAPRELEIVEGRVINLLRSSIPDGQHAHMQGFFSAAAQKENPDTRVALLDCLNSAGEAISRIRDGQRNKADYTTGYRTLMQTLLTDFAVEAQNLHGAADWPVEARDKVTACLEIIKKFRTAAQQITDPVVSGDMERALAAVHLNVFRAVFDPAENNYASLQAEFAALNNSGEFSATQAGNNILVQSTVEPNGLSKVMNNADEVYNAKRITTGPNADDFMIITFNNDGTVHEVLDHNGNAQDLARGFRIAEHGPDNRTYYIDTAAATHNLYSREPDGSYQHHQMTHDVAAGDRYQHPDLPAAANADTIRRMQATEARDARHEHPADAIEGRFAGPLGEGLRVGCRFDVDSFTTWAAQTDDTGTPLVAANVFVTQYQAADGKFTQQDPGAHAIRVPGRAARTFDGTFSKERDAHLDQCVDYFLDLQEFREVIGHDALENHTEAQQMVAKLRILRQRLNELPTTIAEINTDAINTELDRCADDLARKILNDSHFTVEQKTRLLAPVRASNPEEGFSYSPSYQIHVYPGEDADSAYFVTCDYHTNAGARVLNKNHQDHTVHCFRQSRVNGKYSSTDVTTHENVNWKITDEHGHTTRFAWRNSDTTAIAANIGRDAYDGAVAADVDAARTAAIDAYMLADPDPRGAAPRARGDAGANAAADAAEVAHRTAAATTAGQVSPVWQQAYDAHMTRVRMDAEAAALGAGGAGGAPAPGAAGAAAVADPANIANAIAAADTAIEDNITRQAQLQCFDERLPRGQRWQEANLFREHGANEANVLYSPTTAVDKRAAIQNIIDGNDGFSIVELIALQGQSMAEVQIVEGSEQTADKLPRRLIVAPRPWNTDPNAGRVHSMDDCQIYIMDANGKYQIQTNHAGYAPEPPVKFSLRDPNTWQEDNRHALQFQAPNLDDAAAPAVLMSRRYRGKDSTNWQVAKRSMGMEARGETDYAARLRGATGSVSAAQARVEQQCREIHKSILALQAKSTVTNMNRFTAAVRTAGAAGVDLIRGIAIGERNAVRKKVIAETHGIIETLQGKLGEINKLKEELLKIKRISGGLLTPAQLSSLEDNLSALETLADTYQSELDVNQEAIAELEQAAASASVTYQDRVTDHAQDGTMQNNWTSQEVAGSRTPEEFQQEHRHTVGGGRHATITDTVELTTTGVGALKQSTLQLVHSANGNIDLAASMPAIVGFGRGLGLNSEQGVKIANSKDNLAFKTASAAVMIYTPEYSLTGLGLLARTVSFGFLRALANGHLMVSGGAGDTEHRKAIANAFNANPAAKAALKEFVDELSSTDKKTGAGFKSRDMRGKHRISVQALMKQVRSRVKRLEHLNQQNAAPAAQDDSITAVNLDTRRGHRR